MSMSTSELAGFLYRQLFITPAAALSTISLTNQTAIITGSNTGLGFEAAKQLLAKNLSHLILAVRTISRGEAARTSLLSQYPNAKIEEWHLDMEDPTTVTALAKRAEGLKNLKIVILNAGISTSAINFLSTVLLATLLLPTLRRDSSPGAPARLTFVSSEVHRTVRFPERNAPNVLAKLNEENGFDQEDRYPVSKLLTLLWTQELAAKIKPEEVIVNSVNPGFCKTECDRAWTGTRKRSIDMMKKVLARTTEVGARTLVHAAESHGLFISENKITSVSDFAKSEAIVEMSKWAPVKAILNF